MLQVLNGLRCTNAVQTSLLLANFRKEGKEKIMVVADFDYTLTRRYGDNGDKGCLTHEVFHALKDGGVGSTVATLHGTLNEHYDSMMSHCTSKDDRTSLEVEWWNASHGVIIDSKLHRDQLSGLVRHSKLIWRLGMRGWVRLRSHFIVRKNMLKLKWRHVFSSNKVFPPWSSVAKLSEAVPAIEMPTIVSFPDHLLLEENNRRLPDYDFDPILNQPQVLMRDRNAVEKKLRALIEDGKENLMVISDFDYTLSKFEDNQGRKCWTTHGVFDNCVKQVDPELANKFQALKDKYFPIEFDPNLTAEQKVPLMEEWWNVSHGYIVSAGFRRTTIEGFVRRSHILLRDQADHLMRRLHQLRVPLVVFSAGIGNIIEMFLKQKLGQIPGNIRLISNMMNFDEQDIVVSFSEPLIHTYCKNSSVVRKEAQFFHELRERTNIILLGDSMGDIHMDVGVEKKSLTLKIGFLNSDVSNLVDYYMEVYDMVLVQDQSMQIPNSIVQAIADGFVKCPLYRSVT